MNDLSNIRDYAAQVSTKYAEKLVNRLIARTWMLNIFPQSGRAVPEYGHEQIRELIRWALSDYLRDSQCNTN